MQSDSDAKAVKFLEDKFWISRQLRDIAIRTAGRSAFHKCHKKGIVISSNLKKAIQHYLKQDNYLIFVINGADQQRQQGSASLIDQLRGVVKDGNFADKVFLLPDIHECEASVPTGWQRIVSDLRAEVESNRQQFREERDKTMAHFHKAFADTPKEEVMRDFEEALAEVRRERT